jgi:hypothetical protein
MNPVQKFDYITCIILNNRIKIDILIHRFTFEKKNTEKLNSWSIYMNKKISKDIEFHFFFLVKFYL